MKSRTDKRGGARRKALVVAGTALAAAAFIAPPAAAAPASAPTPASVAPASLARCANNVVQATHDANIYNGWDNYDVIGHATAGHNYRCKQGVQLGRRYTACGVSDGNGWIAILVSSDGTHDRYGYAVQACFVDQ